MEHTSTARLRKERGKKNRFALVWTRLIRVSTTSTQTHAQLYSPASGCYGKHDSLAEAGSCIGNIEMQDCAERVRRCTERKLILARESEYCSRSRFDQGRSVETCLSIRKTMIGLDRTELMRTDTAERAVLRNNKERGWRITNACVTRHSIEIHCRGISSDVSPFKLYCEIGRLIWSTSVHLFLWYNDTIMLRN